MTTKKQQILIKTILECIAELIDDADSVSQMQEMLAKMKKHNPKVYINPINPLLDSFKHKKTLKIKFTPALPEEQAEAFKTAILAAGGSISALSRNAKINYQTLKDICDGKVESIEPKLAFRIAKASKFAVKPWDLNSDITKTKVEDEEPAFNFFE